MAEGSGPLLILLQLNFFTSMSKAQQSIETVIVRMQALINAVSGVTNNLNNAVITLQNIEVTRSQQAQLESALFEIRAGLEGCNGLTNYYNNQINNLSTLQQNQSNDLPAVEAQQVDQQQTDMSEQNLPLPGTPAWRIMQRMGKDQADALLKTNSEPVPAPPKVRPVAPAPTPAVGSGPYDHIIPSHAANPNAAPQQTAVTRRAAPRPQRVVQHEQPEVEAVQSEQLLPEVAQQALPSSKLPDPLPVEKTLPTLNLPPNAYQRLTTDKYSPLIRAFAAAPWLENGAGTITVGTAGWPEIIEDIHAKNNFDKVRSHQGFYRKDGDDFPSSVLIRLRTFAVLWNFGTEPGDILVYQVGLSDAGSNDHRWYAAHTLPTSSINRLLGELYTYLKVQEVAFNPMG